MSDTQIIYSMMGVSKTINRKEIIKDIRERTCKIAAAILRTTARTAAAHAAFEGSVAEAIISRLFVSVFQDVVRLVGVLHHGFGVWVVGVSVRVKLFHLLSIGLFDLVRACALGDTQNFIKITL